LTGSVTNLIRTFFVVVSLLNLKFKIQNKCFLIFLSHISLKQGPVFITIADVSNVLLQGKMQLMTTAACRTAYYGITNGLAWAATDSDFNDFVCAGNIPAANGVDTCQVGMLTC